MAPMRKGARAESAADPPASKAAPRANDRSAKTNRTSIIAAKPIRISRHMVADRTRPQTDGERSASDLRPNPDWQFEGGVRYNDD